VSNQNVNQKSIQFSFVSAGRMLLVGGVIFLIIAVVSQFIPIDYRTMTVTSNGVSQPATPETVAFLRMIFLLVFGLFGLAELVLGVVCIRYTITHKKRAQQLRETGERVTAKAVECVPSMLHTFKWWTLTWGIGISSCRGRSFAARRHRHLQRLHCVYKEPGGVTHQFRSDYLREDPLKRLSKREVTVYYEQGNSSCYFVDVDGSVKK